MKKLTVFFVVCALAVVVALAVIPAFAQSPESFIVNQPLWEEDFESYDDGFEWQRQALYLMDSQGIVTQNKSEVVSGDKSLKVVGDSAWGAIYLKYGTVPMRNSTYTLQFRVRTHYVDAVNVEVRQNYANSAENFYSEYGFEVSNDANGNAAAVFDRAGNLGEIEVANASHTLEDGIVNVQFDFTAQNNYALVYICFHSVNEQGFVVLDNMSVTDCNSKGETINVQYKSDFESEKGVDVFSETPFWVNNGNLTWNTTSPFGGKCIQYSGNYYMYNGDNVYLGGLTAAEMVTSPNTMYYYSYDLCLENVEEFVVTTLDRNGLGLVYSEILYYQGTWKLVAAGGIRDLKIENLGNGCWHLSYLRQTSSYGNDEFRLFATSTYQQVSSILIDNFVVGYIG